MKKETKQAYKMLTNRRVVALKKYNNLSNFCKELDFRKKFDKAVYTEIARLVRILNFDQISAKQKERAVKKQIATVPNFIQNPLVKDYFSNKHNILFISDDCIRFLGYRNHWAKNDADKKVLVVLKKHFKI